MKNIMVSKGVREGKLEEDEEAPREQARHDLLLRRLEARREGARSEGNLNVMRGSLRVERACCLNSSFHKETTPVSSSMPRTVYTFVSIHGFPFKNDERLSIRILSPMLNNGILLPPSVIAIASAKCDTSGLLAALLSAISVGSNSADSNSSFVSISCWTHSSSLMS